MGQGHHARDHINFSLNPGSAVILSTATEAAGLLSLFNRGNKTNYTQLLVLNNEGCKDFME